jgi:hypothetical protein
MLGYIVQYNNTTISWKSKKQSTVALSTTEAELYSLSAAVQETLWIKQFLTMLGINIEKTIIYEDNTGTISLVKNEKVDGRTKHVEIKHRFLQDNLIKGNIELEYMKSELQLADVFTKALPKVKFEKFRRELGLMDRI